MKKLESEKGKLYTQKECKEIDRVFSNVIYLADTDSEDAWIQVDASEESKHYEKIKELMKQEKMKLYEETTL